MPVIHTADGRHLDQLMGVMADSFDPRFGEGWSQVQLGGSLALDNCFARRALDPADGRCLGFTLCRTMGPEAEVLLIAVSPPSRGVGLGGRLIDAALADAAARSVVEIFLEVRAGNQGALALYTSRGFVEAGRRPDYYNGSDGSRHAAITMRRPIASARSGSDIQPGKF